MGLPSRPAKFPFYVYGSESGALSDFVASGYMGDTTSLKTVTSAYDPSAPVSTGRTGKTSLKIQYKPVGRLGWAGIYWQTPANNWGKIKGAGFNLSDARSLSFWARGDHGGEVISGVKVGGITGPFPDSDTVSMGPIKLTKDWKQYKLELKGHDLRHIIGGFMILLRRADNPKGATIFFDEIVYLSDKDLDYRFVGSPTTSSSPIDELAKKSVIPEAPVEVAVSKLEPKTVVIQAPPKVVYIEKPVYIVAQPRTEFRPYQPGLWDFLFDLLRRAMEIQPPPFGYDVPLYLWARHLQTVMVPEEVVIPAEPAYE